MTIYTVTLIEKQVRTNEPEVHVFTNENDARSFAFTWMHVYSGLSTRAQFTMSYEEMEEYCLDHNICSVDIESHKIKLP